MEINLLKLFIAAVKTNGSISVDVSEYMADDIQTNYIVIDLDEENKKFIVKVATQEEAENESRLNGE